MRICIRVGVVQDRQNAEPDVQDRCTTVFSSTVQARLQFQKRKRPPSIRFGATGRLREQPSPEVGSINGLVLLSVMWNGSNALLSLFFLLGHYVRVLPNCC